MSELTIEVQRREELGKNANRRLRAAGHIPAVVYGGKLAVTAIQVKNRSIRALLKKSGENPVFLLSLEGTDQTRHAMIREMQRNPTNGELLHIDFQRIEMTEKVRVKIPIEIIGTAEGVKNEGGFLDFVTRSLEVECLPGDIPATLAVDVGPLHVGQHVEARELTLPEEVVLLDEPQRVLVSVAAARVAELEEAEEAEGEELIETEKEEPEVISRGKGEEESG